MFNMIQCNQVNHIFTQDEIDRNEEGRRRGLTSWHDLVFDAAEATKRAKKEKRLSTEKDGKAEKDVALQFGKWSKVADCNVN